MTDKEFFYYTHKIYDPGHNDVLISKLEYFDGNVFGETQLQAIFEIIQTQ